MKEDFNKINRFKIANRYKCELCGTTYGDTMDCETCDASEQTPCNDCVSRQAVLKTLNRMDSVLDEDRTVESYKELLMACYNDLPPVTPVPKKEKSGYWTDNGNGTISCSYCHTWFYQDDRYVFMHYCPSCGAKMIPVTAKSKYAVIVCQKYDSFREQLGVFSTYDEAKAFADKRDFDFDESAEYIEITEVKGGNV